MLVSKKEKRDRAGEVPNFPKSAAFKFPSEKIVEEFIRSGLELAKVKLPPGKKNLVFRSLATA